MPLDLEQVRKVAFLARLKLSDEEVEGFTTQLSELLGYIDLLNEVNTDDVEPMVHSIEMLNVFRDDLITESLPRDAALSNAPKTDGRYFLVPQILDAS